jgi:hypothetical protein
MFYLTPPRHISTLPIGLFCDVSLSVRYPQYRTLSRPIGTGLPGTFLRPNCLRPAQPRQLRRSVLDRLRAASAVDKGPGVSTAPNPRGTCSRSACTDFCPMAVWRRIAQDRRGADHRPLDSRIKAQGGAAVGRERFQKLGASYWFARTLQESEFSFALKKSAQCAKGTEGRRGVPAHMIRTVSRQQRLASAAGPSGAIKARGSRARLRRLTALTGAG